MLLGLLVDLGRRARELKKWSLGQVWKLVPRLQNSD
jgi:hypothetical protein